MKINIFLDIDNNKYDDAEYEMYDVLKRLIDKVKWGDEKLETKDLLDFKGEKVGTIFVHDSETLETLANRS